MHGCSQARAKEVAQLQRQVEGHKATEAESGVQAARAAEATRCVAMVERWAQPWGLAG